MRTFTRLRLIAVFCLSFYFSISVQAQVDFFVNTYIDNVNEKAIASFSADGFTNILSIQGSVSFDTSIFELDTIFLTGLPQGIDAKTFYQPSNSSNLTFNWIEYNLASVTLASGEELFRGIFSLKGNQTGSICLSDDPTPFEFSEANGLILRHTISCQNDKGLITGNVYFDADEDCQPGTAELPLANWKVLVSDGTDDYYTTSGADGSYFLFLKEGDYKVSLVAPNDLWENCGDPIDFTIVDHTTVIEEDLGANALETCPYLTIDVTTPLLRRCFPSYYYINYCNEGTQAASGSYVQVLLDEDVSYVSSSIPFSSQNGQLLNFQLGNINPGECGQFKIEVLVDCDSTFIGQTHCTEATIYPNGPCGGGEEKPVIGITPSCNGNQVVFKVQNNGSVGMDEKAYIVAYADEELLPAKFIQLDAGQNATFNYNADGRTYRLRIQEDNLPGSKLLASAGIEACDPDGDGQFSKGFINAFPLGANDPFTDTDCTENRGSFDPNDKQGFPSGIGTNKEVRPGTEMEYLIRFQNTGTDTAFKVVILDTLASTFNPSTFRIGASSHTLNYKVLEEGILRFTFKDIMLPDSNVNEPASHGFVKYYVQHKPDLALKTELNNTASIYFDFNDPIVTNTTLHTLDEPEIVVSSIETFQPEIKVSAYPNPATERIFIQLDGMEPGKKVNLDLFDINGKLVRSQKSGSLQIEVQRNDLQNGLYFFVITSQEKEKLATGKIVFK
ncbi:MAG: T9SS type A sorting domain-containing protein [Saprospiraceae bacterium]